MFPAGGVVAEGANNGLNDQPFPNKKWLRFGLVRVCVQPLGDQLPADPGDGPRARAQGGDDPLVGALVAEGVVGQEEDAGVGELARRRLAAGNHLLQVRPLLRRQGHAILVHGSRPVLEVPLSVGRRGTGYRADLSNEDG